MPQKIKSYRHSILMNKEQDFIQEIFYNYDSYEMLVIPSSFIPLLNAVKLNCHEVGAWMSNNISHKDYEISLQGGKELSLTPGAPFTNMV